MHTELTREEVVEVLLENGYMPGAADPDPEKDATHIYTRRDGTAWAMFSKSEPSVTWGGLIGNDGTDGEAGCVFTYEKLVAVAAGLITPERALAIGSLSDRVMKKLAQMREERKAGLAAATTADVPALPPAKEEEETEDDECDFAGLDKEEEEEDDDAL